MQAAKQEAVEQGKARPSPAMNSRGKLIHGELVGTGQG